MLADELRARIEREGPLRMDAFLQACLDAYYGAGPDIGARGDFFTAANVSLFPHALRRFVDAAMKRLEGARIVELGGGTGALAASLGAPVTIVEPNAGLAARQRERGLDVVASLDELKPAPTLFLANEVLDALPVRRILFTNVGPREGRVAWDGARFVEVPAPLPEDLAPHAARLALPPGTAAEVNVGVDALIAAMARAAPRSLALFLDYGGETAQLYGEHRPHGTLRGFRAHRVTDALEAPGEQDVTADVDLTHVAEVASRHGFARAGDAAQGELLADLGLVDDMQSALMRGDTAAYLAAKNLLLSGGMGERFRALLLTRDVPTEPTLPGFRKDLSPGLARR